jgi:hypothetical protein
VRGPDVLGAGSVKPLRPEAWDVLATPKHQVIGKRAPCRRPPLICGPREHHIGEEQ